MNKTLSVLRRIICFVVLTAIAFSVFAVGGVAYADEAESSGTYGGKNANELWYYKEGFYDLAAIKTAVNGWTLPAAADFSPIVIAVVDTGCNTSHSVFSDTGTLYKNSSGTVIGYNSYVAVKTPNATPTELGAISDKASDSHGTAVASIIAMTIKELGLQDYIKICPVKASFTESGKEGFLMSSIAEGVRWAADVAGAQVINVSVSSIESATANWANNSVVKATMLSASEKAVIVAAAGNDGKSTNELVTYPASYPGVLSVMGYKSDGTKNTNGNYGAYDVIAPGTSIYAASGSTSGYQTLTGTSMAAAFVSVTAALLRLKDAAAGADVDASVVERHIRSTYTSYVGFASGGVTYELPKHSPALLLTTGYSNTYVEPRGIELSETAFTSEIMRGQGTELKLSAYLSPYGTVNPALDENINWYLVEIGTKTVDENGDELETPVEYEISKTHICSGKNFSYVPDEGGTFAVRAEYGDFYAEKRFTLKYASYDSVANGVRIVLSDELTADEPSSSATVFTAEELEFAFSYSQRVNPHVETKWYVNGEYAASGNTFLFSERKAGTYTVSAQYGDYSRIEKTFTVTVESSVGRPESIAAIAFAGVGIIIFASAAIAATVKRKKA